MIDYLKGTEKILKASEKETEKYDFKTLGKKFIGHPKVFPAKYFSDSKFFGKILPIEKNQIFLEIGSGTGVISILMALKGAKVTATDINPKAIENTKKNAQLHNVNIEILEGDLFGPLKERKFDAIFWNCPFGYTHEKNISMYRRSVYDPEYETLTRFAENVKDHLNPNGRIFIGFSSTIGNYPKLKGIFEKQGYIVKVFEEIIDSQGNKDNLKGNYPSVKYELLEIVTN